MRRLLPYLVLATLAAVGIAYLVLGPSVFIGGPTKAAIVDATRAAMVASAATPEEQSAAQSATITPQGLCSRGGDGSHACMVEVVAVGAPPQTFVSTMRKDATGNWVPVE